MGEVPNPRKVGCPPSRSSHDVALGRTRAPLALVRGIGEVGSAVAHRLLTEGWCVAIHQGPMAPKAHRSGMAFTDAWFDGRASLDGIAAQRLDRLDSLPALLAVRQAIAVLVAPLEEALALRPWGVLIDARLQKRDVPEDQRGLAPLVVGLGPGFVAGETVDLAIETSWGDRLGEFIRNGSLPCHWLASPAPLRALAANASSTRQQRAF